MRTIYPLLLLIFSFFSSLAQEIVPAFAPQNYICQFTSEPLDIDGRPNEAGWLQAAWTDDFVDIEGDKQPFPRFRTRAKMLWDEDYFYFFAEMEEPHIWATLRQRDTVIFYDNDFEIFIDPDGDSHRYYEFEMNAFNTIWDLMLITPYRDHANAVLNSWDMRGIKTAVDVQGTLNDPSDEDEKWTVEIALPWEALKEQASGQSKPEPGEHWRVNFSRVEWQVDVVDGKYQKRTDSQTGKRLREDNWVWSPQGAINMHRPETWGFVQFAGTNAGELGDFEIPAYEYTKWELRKLYYAQRSYRAKHQQYAERLNQLETEIPDQAEIIAGLGTYIISLPGLGAVSWYIDEQGHTWSSEK